MSDLLPGIVFALFVVAACTELPPVPAGTGGGGGDGAVVGDGGLHGGGGSAGGTVCSDITWSRTDLLEGDAVVLGVADGTVSDSSDLVDRWGIVVTCDGLYDIVLTWEDMMRGLDLNLAILDSGEGVIALGSMGNEEERLAGIDLDAGELFFVEVRAINTDGVNSLNYTLRVAPSQASKRLD